MDTNVFISTLKPDDPYHPEANEIWSALRENRVRAETSVLTLVECASVASRMYQTSKGVKGSDRERKVFIVKTLKKLASLNLSFIHILGDSPMPVKGVAASAPSLFNEAILFSLEAPLRTFDLMHLAAARHGRQTNPELGAFVTGDGELLSRKAHLSELVSMPILSPREYAKAVGIRR